MERIVGIGECAVSNVKFDTIKTFALASCVAVSVYSPSKKTAGMIHVALPAPLEEYDIVARPYYFATTGVPKFIDKVIKKYGCIKEDLIIGIYGGANSINDRDLFNIGKRNIVTVRNELNNLNLKICYSEVGGNISRSLTMSVATGVIKITTYPLKV